MGLQLRSPSNQIIGAMFAAVAATVAKVPFVQQGKVAIPLNAAGAGVTNEHVVQSEVSGAPKAPAEAWAPLQTVYWDDTNKRFTTTASGNTACGYALAAALAADTVTPLFLFKSN